MSESERDTHPAGEIATRVPQEGAPDGIARGDENGAQRGDENGTQRGDEIARGDENGAPRGEESARGDGIARGGNSR